MNASELIAPLAAATIVLPLLAAPMAFLAGRRSAPALPLATGFVVLASAVALAGEVAALGGVSHALGGWEPPLGIAWRIDGLAVLMVLLTAVLCQGIALYAAGHLPRAELHGEASRFWPPFLFLWGGLNAVFLSADLFHWYVTLELVSLSAVVLVTLPGKGPALTAGMRYLLVSQAGSLAYLTGLGFIYAGFGTLAVDQVGQRMAPSPAASAALALMSAGLFAKTAFMPLHGWLPMAHGSAPAPASALLSGLVVKASFYVLLRLWIEALGPAASEAARQLAGACGAAAVLWGSVLALRQTRLKLLIAYSTIAQIGYLLMVLPLTGGDHKVASDALLGGIMLVLSHAFAKAAMFMAAGLFLEALGHDRLKDIQGAAQHMPMTVSAIGLAGITLVSLPPSGGFAAKWLMLHAAMESGQWWWVPVLLAGGLLAGAYVFLVMARAFFRAEGQAGEFRPVPHWLEVLTLLVALISVLLGFLVGPIAALLEAKA